MKIPFDIKYKPQIESGEYKVEIKNGNPVEIICWDRRDDTTNRALVGIIRTGSVDEIAAWTKGGKLCDAVFPESPAYDLFIVTPEEELSEFEKAVGLEIFDEPFNEKHIKVIKEESAKLLSFARDQFIKDGYVLEKKSFHDAVEKVEPEVMKEVSDKVDMANEELTEFERELESFYNHHLQVCTYDNQGTVEDSLHDGASKLIAIARKEMCDQIIDELKKLLGFKEDEK